MVRKKYSPRGKKSYQALKLIGLLGYATVRQLCLTVWENERTANDNVNRLLENHYDPVAAIKRFKRFAFYFSANFRFGHSLYTKILKAGNMKEVNPILKRFFEQDPEVAARPNLNYFN